MSRKLKVIEPGSVSSQQQLPQASPFFYMQEGRAGAQLGASVSGAGGVLNRLALEQQRQENNRYVALEEDKTNATEAAIQEYIANNPEKPDSWKSFAESQWKARSSQIEQKGSNALVLEAVQNQIKDRQLRNMVSVRTRSIKESIRNNNILFRSNAEKAWNAGRMDDFEDNLSKMQIPDAQKQALRDDIQRKGEWQDLKLEMQTLEQSGSVKEIRDWADNLLEQENDLLGANARKQLVYEARAKAARKEISQNSRYLSNMRAVLNGSINNQDPIISQFENGQISDTQKNTLIKAIEDNADQLKANSQYKQDKQNLTYKHVDSLIKKELLSSDLILGKEGFESIRNMIGDLNVGDVAKAELLAKATSARSVEVVAEGAKPQGWFSSLFFDPDPNEIQTQEEVDFRKKYLQNMSSLLMKNKSQLRDGDFSKLIDMFNEQDLEIKDNFDSDKTPNQKKLMEDLMSRYQSALGGFAAQRKFLGDDSDFSSELNQGQAKSIGRFKVEVE